MKLINFTSILNPLKIIGYNLNTIKQIHVLAADYSTIQKQLKPNPGFA